MIFYNLCEPKAAVLVRTGDAYKHNSKRPREADSKRYMWMGGKEHSHKAGHLF